MADSQKKQKEQEDAKIRRHIERYEVDDQVLRNAKNLPLHVVSAEIKTKLRSRFIGTFTVVSKKGLAYTLNLSCRLLKHPVFYGGLLEQYQDPSHVDPEALSPRKLALTPPAHPNQDAKLSFHTCLILLKHQQTSLHSVKLALGLT